jgi:hypothetical protein
MMKLALLFLTTGVFFATAVTALVGMIWVAVGVPLLIIVGAGYGIVALKRWGARILGYP